MKDTHGVDYVQMRHVIMIVILSACNGHMKMLYQVIVYQLYNPNNFADTLIQSNLGQSWPNG